MGKKFFLFIVLIRALAAILITNAHYTGVYPTDLIANGGLLGDVLFFAVSGFCLASIKGGFGNWYVKRFVRVYIPSWVITLIYIFLGAYVVNDWKDIISFFVWPTHWHFVASIILLYIPLFYVSKHIDMNVKNYSRLAGGLFVCQIFIYLTIYDNSYYHIDNVREPMIEFLFFQSMLLGLHYRWRSEHTNIKKLRLKWEIVFGGLLLGLYFVSKLLFVKMPFLASFQILNQIILWTLLYILFDILMHTESFLRKIENSFVWKCLSFISERTLEIYLVQYVIIDKCKFGIFPINWLILSATIIISAMILRWISQQIIKRIKI